MSVSVPIKLLHEGEGHVVTVELRNGELYRGQLKESEENMNCQLSNVLFTARDGRVRKMEHVYLRGSQIRFLVLPDLLKNAPLFKKVQTMKEKAAKTDKPGPKGAAKGGGRGGGAAGGGKPGGGASGVLGAARARERRGLRRGRKELDRRSSGHRGARTGRGLADPLAAGRREQGGQRAVVFVVVLVVFLRLPLRPPLCSLAPRSEAERVRAKLACVSSVRVGRACRRASE